MDNNLIYVGIDAISIAMMVLLVARFFQISKANKISWFVLLIGLGVISYVLSSRQDYGVLIDEAFRADFGTWFPLLNLLRNSTAAWFVLICHTVFRDGERIPRALIALIVVQLFIEEPLGWIIGESWGPAFWITFVHELIPASIQIVYLVLGMYWTMSQRDADLDETRRGARLVFLAVYLSQATLSLLVERVAMGYELIPFEYHYPIHVTLVGIGALFTIYAVFALMSANTISLFAPLVRNNAVNADDAVPDEREYDVQRIRDALESERIYRQAGLSVAQLAVHLALPEYRLRALIHDHLGYRNFNALLHHYRVLDVSAALADERQKKTPILTLALSAGYQSINPFNRAFRDITGMTPTEFRREATKKQIDSSKTAPISESDQSD